MKKDTVLTPTTKVVQFDDYENLEPENLFKFSEEYLDNLPLLKKFIADNYSKRVVIPAVRMISDGTYQRKSITGILGQITENSFTIHTNEDFYNVYKKTISLLIRFDNTLGIIPLHPQQPGMNPVTVDLEDFKNYFSSLSKMKDLMKECLTTVEHAVTLYYRYTKNKPNFRDGNYQVDCEIIEVNRSNVRYKHFRTFTHLAGTDKYNYVDICPRDEIDRFIAPDRYLQKVNVVFGVKQNITPYDDGEGKD